MPVGAPKPGKRNVLITSALPYVNNVPHLGNIVGSVLSGDVFTRYCRLRDYHCIHIGGTDEYGTATETKALEQKRTPQQVCNEYHAIHADIYKWFNIDFDEFGRTTTELQTKLTQEMFLKLEANNYLFKDSIEQLFCCACERFLADRFVEGICPYCSYEDARGDQCDKCGKLINAIDLKSPKCKLCKTQPVLRTSEHFFFDLPKFQDRLRAWFDNIVSKSTFSKSLKLNATDQDAGESTDNQAALTSQDLKNSEHMNDNYHWTNVAKGITDSWLKEGLKPRCITRDLKWGTKVPHPGFEDKVFYVWFDAPVGYLSISAKHTDDWQKWWKGEFAEKNVELFQFMAKDNVAFHSILFRAALMGTEEVWIQRQNIIAVDYLNYENTKFSKSRGVGVFGSDAKDTGIPADIWRFYLMYVRPEGMDSSFTWDDFKEKVNSELLNNLGNFINRALSFIEKNFNSVLTHYEPNLEDENYLSEVGQNLIAYFDHMERVHLRDALKPILAISRLGNQLIQANKPWVLVKGSDEEKKRAESVMYIVQNTVALISLILSPYMPDISCAIKEQLSFDGHQLVDVDYDFDSTTQNFDFKKAFPFLLPLNHKIGKPVPLFKRIEPDTIKEFKNKFGPAVETQPSKVKKPKQPKQPKVLKTVVNGSNVEEKF